MRRRWTKSVGGFTPKIPALVLLFGIYARLTRQEGTPLWERLDPPGLATRLRRRSRGHVTGAG